MFGFKKLILSKIIFVKDKTFVYIVRLKKCHKRSIFYCIVFEGWFLKWFRLLRHGGCAQPPDFIIKVVSQVVSAPLHCAQPPDFNLETVSEHNMTKEHGAEDTSHRWFRLLHRGGCAQPPDFNSETVSERNPTKEDETEDT